MDIKAQNHQRTVLKVGVRDDLERAPDPGLLCLLMSLMIEIIFLSKP